MMQQQQQQQQHKSKDDEEVVVEDDGIGNEGQNTIASSQRQKEGNHLNRHNHQQKQHRGSSNRDRNVATETTRTTATATSNSNVVAEAGTIQKRADENTSNENKATTNDLEPETSSVEARDDNDINDEKNESRGTSETTGSSAIKRDGTNKLTVAVAAKTKMEKALRTHHRSVAADKSTGGGESGSRDAKATTTSTDPASEGICNEDEKLRIHRRSVAVRAMKKKKGMTKKKKRTRHDKESMKSAPPETESVGTCSLEPICDGDGSILASKNAIKRRSAEARRRGADENEVLLEGRGYTEEPNIISTSMCRDAARMDSHGPRRDDVAVGRPLTDATRPGAVSVVGMGTAGSNPPRLDEGHARGGIQVAVPGQTDAVIIPVAYALNEEDEIEQVQEQGQQHQGSLTIHYPKISLQDTRTLFQNRRFQLYLFFACTLLMSLAIGVSVGIKFVRRSKEQVFAATVTPTNLPTEAPYPGYQESLGIRDVIGRTVGEELLRGHNSSYYKALEWILFDDPMQLTPESANLIQRYTAAYLWFATTELSEWKSCNLPTNNTNTTCMREYLSHDDETNSMYVSEPSHAWLSNISECEWAGIVCDEIGQIKSIELAGSGLSGTFPEGIYHLPYLQHIGFSDGRLRGPLPQKLVQNMHHLYSIVLSNNQFTGPLPHDWFTSGRHLQAIVLRSNLLSSSIPVEVGNLRDLKYLEIGRNRLTGTLPSELGLLDSLTYLDVSKNEVQGEIPESIGNSKNSNLVRLWLHQNDLVGSIPSNIGQVLINLNELSLHTNPRLTGNIPDTLYDLPKLEILDLHDSDFSGTISSRIGNLGDTLVVFNVANNRFNGTIPSELSNLSNLQMVRFHQNFFTGSIPDTICSIQNQRYFEITADCAPNDNGAIELSCSCCTLCCQSFGAECWFI